MEEIKLMIPLSDLKYDVVGRVDLEDPDLEDNLLHKGQNEPLRVQGPDKDGKYIITSGRRRFEAMKKKPSHFKSVWCIVTHLKSKTERAIDMLNDEYHHRRKTRFEKQLMIQEVLNAGISKKELSKRINKAPSTIYRETRGIGIPEEKRRSVHEVGGSQDALVTIYTRLKCDATLKNILYKKLLEGIIATDDSKALNRVAKQKEYDLLDMRQKERIIEKTLDTHKFTNEKAKMLLMIELMKQDPEAFPDYVNEWINHICNEIEQLSTIVNPQMNEMVSTYQKKTYSTCFFYIEKFFKVGIWGTEGRRL